MTQTLIVPSEYQIKVFDTYENTSDNLLIAAVAGSGKTTTLVQLIDKTPRHKSLMYVAFNKHIVEELLTRVEKRQNVTIGTLHSRGYGIIMQNHGNKIKLDDWKTFNVCRKLMNGLHWKSVPKDKKNIKLNNIAEFYDFYRLTHQTSLTKEVYLEIINKYGVNLSIHDFQITKEVIWEVDTYNQSHKSHEPFMIDFIDMIYLPVFLNFQIKQVDILLVDEAQDLSKIQQELLKRILKSDSRLVVVGDPNQSIYRFAGSDTESWEMFKTFPKMVELPLSYCYRCGKDIVDYANKVYDTMESPEWKESGLVVQDSSIHLAKVDDFIVCRNTKPLVDLYFIFLDKEIPAYIKGSDIGIGLIKILKGYEKLSSENLIKELKQEGNKIYMELKTHGVSSPQKHSKYINFVEKLEVITVFAMKYDNTQEIIDTIKRIFTNEGKGIILSTIHKAKGLEADRVFLFLPSLIPSKYASTPEELIQESNLLYVAITRAKKELHIVNEID